MGLYKAVGRGELEAIWELLYMYWTPPSCAGAILLLFLFFSAVTSIIADHVTVATTLYTTIGIPTITATTNYDHR